MITRFNYIPIKKRDTSHDDDMITYELVKKIKPITTNKDGSVKDYVEEQKWVAKKSKWSEYIASFDIGTVSDQVISHLTKGTPLITAHTLPDGDYTQLEKGAEIKREMAEKGITLEMIIQAVQEAEKIKNKENIENKEVNENA